MTISFSKIPTNLRVPFVFSEIDATGANQARTPYKGLIAAQMTTGGSRAVVVATSAPTASGTTLTFASAAVIQAVRPGMAAIDRTTAAAIPAGLTVLSIAGAAVTMSGAVTGVLTADSIEFYDLTPTNMNSLTNASALFGPGSQISRMYRQWRANNSFGEVWVLPLPDDANAAAATGTIAFVGPATANGTFFLMVAGTEIPVVITNAMTASQAGTAVAAAVNAAKDLPVTASGTATVTLTAKNRGLAGNNIDIRVNYFGIQSGEVDVPGLLYTITPMAGGTTNPTVALTAGLAALPPYRWGYVATPYGTDSATLNAERDWMSDATGQWAWLSMMYGHVFTAQSNTLGTLQTNGAARNDQHVSIMGFYDSPTPPEEWAAQIAAAVQQRLDADPGANLDGMALPGVLAPRPTSQFHLSDQNTLLWNGISTFTVDRSGLVRVQKLITTYQLNQFSSADDTFLEPETLYRVAFALTDLKADLETNFAGARLAPDGTRFGPGVKVVTPKLATARCVTRYAAMEEAGIVVNTAGFSKAIFAEIDANNPRRLDISWPGVIIHDLDIIAILARLNG